MILNLENGLNGNYYLFSYAKDQGLFFDDFAKTFKKLVELGWEGKLTEVELPPLQLQK